MSNNPHQSHEEVIKRLKRADGHLRKIISMIESERPCADVAQQLQAVESAVRNAKRVFIRDHIDHCLDDRLGAGGSEVVADLKLISKYL
ncbi:MAG: metal resistance protein [Gammaproteobacteria bacterium]|nr:metal resistance protein [Gammaproteobacteria bacterium]